MCVGVGVGMLMQNLVLATQNKVAPSDLGAASSPVAFFRSLGGAIGVSALGAVLATGSPATSRTAWPASARNAAAAPARAAAASRTWTSCRPRSGRVVESAYGHGIGDVFLYRGAVRLLSPSR